MAEDGKELQHHYDRESLRRWSHVLKCNGSRGDVASGLLHLSKEDCKDRGPKSLFNPSIQKCDGEAVVTRVVADGNIVNLQNLTEGICEDIVLVKVDRIICKEMLVYPYGLSRPMKELVALQLIVFDHSNYRMVVSLEDYPTIKAFARVLVEDRCYMMKNFSVIRNKDGWLKKYHLKLHPTTQVICAAASFPKHVFNLMTVPQAITRVPRPGCLVDISGFLITLYEVGMSEAVGVYTKELIMVLAETGEMEVSGSKALSYSLYGSCAETTIQAYEVVSDKEPLFVVIQYAMETGRNDGGPILTSYYNSTRVFFNPTFPDVLQQMHALM